jgi:P pilus assembly chaperone PapD
MSTRMIIRAIAIAAWAVLASALASVRPATALGQGVTVAPTVVVLDHRARGGSVDLFNPAPTPVEVAISLLYGIPVTDEAGDVSLHTDTLPPASEPAARWIDVYPRRVTILPGQRQTIRFLARPPADLPDREYWMRIVVSSKGAPLELNQPDSTGVAATLNVEIRTVTTLLYRKGSPTAALTIETLHPTVFADSLVVRAKLTPSGTAAWLGTASGTLVSPDGKVVGAFERPMGIYRSIEPRFVVQTDSLPPGTYKLRFEVRGQRSDLPRSTILPFTTHRDSVDVIIPPRRP